MPKVDWDWEDEDDGPRRERLRRQRPVRGYQPPEPRTRLGRPWPEPPTSPVTGLLLPSAPVRRPLHLIWGEPRPREELLH